MLIGLHSARSRHLVPDEALPIVRSRMELVSGIRTIRAFERAVLDMHRAETIAGSVHVCIGQEVVPLIATSVLDDRDRILATYRGHGWALACGVPYAALLAELAGRHGGVNGGRGGSAYFSAPEYGFVGENSIVGAGLPIANGVAIALERRGDGGVAVVSFGDGATNQGASFEALVFAVARTLPVVFVCENNDWSEMTPIAATAPGIGLATRASAFGMPAVSVDASEIDGVHAALDEAVSRARSGGGPSFVEIRVPRLAGHYQGDIEHYRTAEERSADDARDPLIAAELLLASEVGSRSQDMLHELEIEASRVIAEARAIAEARPVAEPGSAADHVVHDAPSHPPSDAGGAPLKYNIAVNRALQVELRERPEVVVFGEDVGVPGGIFGVTRNLRKEFGERVFDTPISEAAILGAAVGAAMEGLRPVVEVMWSDFLFVALDQLVNQAANVRYLSSGRLSAPLVVRTQQGITPGSCAQHSQSVEAVLAHVPGIKVGLPATSSDAYSMVRAAIADPDPVVLIESRALYQELGEVDVGGPVEHVGGARFRRRGADAGVITWSRMVHDALQAADDLAAEGINVAVLDLRWLNPIDDEAITELVASTGGRVLVVHEANVTGGFGAELSARISERHFRLLAEPVMRLGMPDVRVPAAPSLQHALRPNPSTIRAALQTLLGAAVTTATTSAR